MKIGIGFMASGKGSRMGENKLLMTIHGKTMIKHMTDKVSRLKAEIAKKSPQSKNDYELEIVVASCYDEIIELAKQNNCIAIYNHKADLGQSESIKLIVKTLSHCDGIVFLPCDQIYISEISIHRIIKTFVENKGQFPVQASFQGAKSSPVIVPRAFYEDLLSLEGDVGGKVLLKEKKVILVEVSQKELIDIDKSEDISKHRL